MQYRNNVWRVACDIHKQCVMACWPVVLCGRIVTQRGRIWLT